MEVKMQKIRYGFIVVGMLLCPVTYASAQVNIGIGLPTVSIGINLPLYPNLVPVPGYPVYYAPRMDANYFFYDGMYWVYQNDNWYASSWYNGPWWSVDPYDVPLYILRIPVRYYRQPPVYFRGWLSNAPPRWGEHWGHGWEQRRSGWNKWNRRSAPSRAPLPVYQRQYTGDRYPRAEQQQSIRSQHYRYQPRDTIVRKHFQPQAPAAQHQRAPAAQHQQAPAAQHQQAPAAQHQQAPAAQHQRAPAAQHQQAPVVQHQRAPAAQHQRAPAAQHQQREQQAPRAQGRDEKPDARGGAQDSGPGHGRGQKNEEDHGRGR
jgi:hypothetical protein